MKTTLTAIALCTIMAAGATSAEATCCCCEKSERVCPESPWMARMVRVERAPGCTPYDVYNTPYGRVYYTPYGTPRSFFNPYAR